MYQVHILTVSIRRAQFPVDFRERPDSGRYLRSSREVSGIRNLGKCCCVGWFSYKEKRQDAKTSQAGTANRRYVSFYRKDTPISGCYRRAIRNGIGGGT
jgi:hypothetical protein